MNRKAEIFTEYGDDVAGALRNWAQIDPEGFDHFERTATSRQYLADYRAWRRRQTVTVSRQAPDPTCTLFPTPPAKADPVDVRSTLVHDGDEVALLDLAGVEGAALIRQIANRDAGPAKTTLSRCDRYRVVADLIEARSGGLGRPVSVREALGLVAA